MLKTLKTAAPPHSRRDFLGLAIQGSAVAAAATLPGISAAAQIKAQIRKPGPSSITIVPGREFAADSYVHRPLAPNEPIGPNSQAYVAEVVRQAALVVSCNTHSYSPPIWIVPAGIPTVQVKGLREDAWEASEVTALFPAVPLPDGFAQSPGTDGEAVVYQPSTGKYWEFWEMRKTGAQVRNSVGVLLDEWGASSGGRLDNIASNRGAFQMSPGGWPQGTQASGVPFLAGIMTIEEQRAGVINHPLLFMVGDTGITTAPPWQVFPAWRTDGWYVGGVPEGVRFRLPARLDIEALGLPPWTAMIAKALQKYGMYLTDGCGRGVVFRAENPGPAGRYASDPYYGAHGILNPTATEYTEATAPPETWPMTLLAGFPWDRLQALVPPAP
jgi:hypothetical protein